MKNNIIAPSDNPFRWKGADYRIKECGIEDGTPYASVDPPNTQLENELCRRIDEDGGLRVYLASGYICFIEDYPNISTGH